ncbi:hypothetical protein Bca101_015476 [Brassica carinata]
MSSLFTPFSAALPLRHTRPTVSCCSSGHVSFIKDVAVTEPPMHLQHLLKVLQTRGETIISPGAKQGLIPLAIPLSKDSSGSVTALLRWPTAPPGEVSYRLTVPGIQVDEYIHRILVEEDAKELSELYIASEEAGEKLYKKGAFAESQIDNLDVGLFPDVLERKVLRHFDEGDHEVASIAQWEDEQIEFIREKVSDEGRFEDLKKGKDPLQVALDVAAFLLDLASIEGTWSESLHHIAKCYEEAGLKEISNFILYTDEK